MLATTGRIQQKQLHARRKAIMRNENAMSFICLLLVNQLTFLALCNNHESLNKCEKKPLPGVAVCGSANLTFSHNCPECCPMTRIMTLSAVTVRMAHTDDSHNWKDESVYFSTTRLQFSFTVVKTPLYCTGK